MMHVDLELDLKGAHCPLPLLKAKQAMNQLNSGQTLRVLTTDPGSVRDFTSFARLAGHRLLVNEERLGVFTYVLKHK